VAGLPTPLTKTAVRLPFFCWGITLKG
jgi:hypothetical protein